MSAPDDSALLWSFRIHEREVRCLRQPSGSRWALRVLLGDSEFLTEEFPDLARLAARAEQFRQALESHGWHRSEQESPPASGVATPLHNSTAGAGAPPDERSPDEPPAHPRLPARTPAVLVVDDEPAVRSFLRAYLEDAEYVVYEAADIDSALTALDEREVDAVVLDVRMPDASGLGRTGLEVLAFIRLRAASGDLPVLILTGQSLDPEEQKLISRHRADLFLKPEGYRKLLQRLDQLTGRRGGSRP
jgi:CheY-like chemotaxis protein